MNKSDLIERLAEETGHPYQTVNEAVHLIFDLMSEELVRGGRIEIRGFGSFAVRTYAAYSGRNPRTGDAVSVKPKRLPHFKVGKELRERVDASSNI